MLQFTLIGQVNINKCCLLTVKVVNAISWSVNHPQHDVRRLGAGQLMQAANQDCPTANLPLLPIQPLPPRSVVIRFPFFPPTITLNFKISASAIFSNYFQYRVNYRHNKKFHNLLEMCFNFVSCIVFPHVGASTKASLYHHYFHLCQK